MGLDISDEIEAAIGAAQTLAAGGDVAAATDAFEAILDSLGDDHVQAAAVLHMYAVVVEDLPKKLAINEEALRRADAAADFPPGFRASLLANIGYSHRALGNIDLARSWYVEAQTAASLLPDDDYGRMIRDAAANAVASLSSA
jgi:tetratricopeptide (TPR) repeat protein